MRGRSCDGRQDNSWVCRAQVGPFKVFFRDGQCVGQEHGVQFAFFSDPRGMAEIIQLQVIVGRPLPVAPGAGMHAKPHDAHADNHRRRIVASHDAPPLSSAAAFQFAAFL